MAIVTKTWKPIQLEGSIFNNGTAEGLIGIEMCTDYDDQNINRPKKKRKNNSSILSKRPKKFKTIQQPTPSKSGSTEDTVVVQEINSFSNGNDNFESMKSWHEYGLPEAVLKALQEQHFLHPTEIQAYTLPSAILGKRDILGAAETGSGKTLAFGLPIITGILSLKNTQNEELESNSDDSDLDIDLDTNELGCVKAYKLNDEATLKKPLYALIITPTRELAIQVKNHLTNVAKYTGINIAVVVGGMAAVKQERLLSKGPEIVVGTPGRLWELIQQGNDHLSQIDNIKFLAIDETDRMLEKGHFQELQELLERLNLSEVNRIKRQNFVFSATLTLIHDIPIHLINKSKIKGKKLNNMSPEQKLQKIVNVLGITNPKIVDLSQGKGTSGTLTECRITCAIDEKDYYVYYFLKKHPGRTLIFCNSIGCVKRLTTLLTLLNCGPLPLHANMQQRQRLKNLERFRDIENSILVATDVAARGLDIPKIDHVLHYQTPRTSESYVHRSGRTARASKQGITVLIMEPNEFRNYIKLCKTLEKDEDLPLFPIQEQYLKAVKERVNLARDLDKLQLQVRKANSEEGWLQKAAQEMDIIIDEIGKKYDDKVTLKIQKLADLKRKQLTGLLATPVFPRTFNGKFPQFGIETTFSPVEENAVDLMRNAVENSKKTKIKHIPLYKAKEKGKTIKENVIIKLNKPKKNVKKNNKTSRQ
ncbi:hypothetical protein ABEB36_002313 [Hypothenemus hampei]|uniref:ATP-dependent RNA helicase n=1 Tax=Hypothenemus hampei TaxID=57062 RepID=A0ABD1F8E6_HYPHA